MTRRQFLLLIVPLLAVLVGFALVGYLEERGAGSGPWDEGLERALRNAVAREFVRGAGTERDGWNAYFEAQEAYLKYFDRNNTIVPPWNVKAAEEEASGRKVSIGVLARGVRDDGKAIVRLEIVGVKPKGPADGAGVRVGDSILAVDGVTVKELCQDGRMDGALHAISGEENTNVRLRLAGESGAEREVAVLRAELATGSVFGGRIVDAERGIGYVRLASFHRDTGRDFREKLAELKQKGLKALVLDLRGNRGGLLDQAVSVADAFLDHGVVVRVRSRRGTDVHEAKADDTDARGLPLAVLVDGGSASSSEVLAGALQDHRRGVLVGERTYGKFSVQTMTPIPCKAEPGLAYLKITTALYETPSGRFYPRTRSDDERGEDPLAGLRPDVHVPIPGAERDVLYGTPGRTEGIFEEERLAEWKTDPASAHPGFVDRQLAAAIGVLRGETVYPELVRES